MANLSYCLRREWFSLILAGVLGVLVLNCFIGPLGPHDLLVLRRHRARLEATRNQLLAENSQLTVRIAKLRSDDAFIQRLIRRELGYARPDEFVYRFPHEPPGPSPSRESAAE